jgi:hypothetical protein
LTSPTARLPVRSSRGGMAEIDTFRVPSACREAAFERGSTNYVREENDRETDGTVTVPPVLRPSEGGLERLDQAQ